METMSQVKPIFEICSTLKTDALGNGVFRSFDPFGNVVEEWGATYPVRYTYDSAGRRTSLSTTRNEKRVSPQKIKRGSWFTTLYALKQRGI